MADEKDKPTPVQPPGRSSQGSPLRPLPTRAELAPEPKPTPDGPDLSDPVEKHLHDFPEGVTPKADTLAEPQASLPGVDVPKPADVPVAKKAGEIPPVPGKDAPPAVETPTEPKAVDTPVPVAKPSYDPNEKIGIADGVEWTRGQVLAALQERAELQKSAPKAAEADTFREVFLEDAAAAKQHWTPIITALRENPQKQNLADVVVGADPTKVAYLAQCAQYYDENPPEGVPAAQPQKVASDPTLVKEVGELRAWREQQQQREAVDRVNREVSEATRKYPFLAQDQGLMQDLILSAKALNMSDPSKGILDALQAKASVYDAILIARGVKPAEAPVAVPTLAGPGASPTGPKPAHDSRPQKFPDLDDGVEAWLRAHPE